MHPLATKPLPRQTQKHKASDAALPAASQFYERRNPASGTSASSAKTQKGRQVFQLLPESTIAKKACSICLISHRVAGRMTRESHLTRSSHPSLPHESKGSRGRRSRRSRCPACWKMQEKRPGSFSLVLWQTLKNGQAHLHPFRTLPPLLTAPSPPAADNAQRCQASPIQLCPLCPLHALDSLRTEMHKDGPMLCGKHKQI
ncbi:hypothetical protein V2W45_119127 [Cenococcum geophilum]